MLNSNFNFFHHFFLNLKESKETLTGQKIIEEEIKKYNYGRLISNFLTKNKIPKNYIFLKIILPKKTCNYFNNN